MGNVALQKKLARVKNSLKKYPGVVVAFSGGVDSSLLLKIAKEALGGRVIAVTAVSPLHPQEELKEAKKIARKLHCPHLIIQSHALRNKKLVSNSRNRCYYCKKQLFTTFRRLARKYGYEIIEASNVSDLRDYRPGLRALTELKVESPFIQAAINKKEIRILAKKFGLPNWNRPSMACLASRIPYGHKVSKKTLRRIESAEKYLKRFQLTQIRVRDYFPTARIEVFDNEFHTVITHRKKIIAYFQKLGYTHVALDLEGYRTGSLNR